MIGNDYEIKLIQEKTGWKMEDILKCVEAVIITLGEKGSMVVTTKEAITVGICPANSVDDQLELEMLIEQDFQLMFKV